MVRLIDADALAEELMHEGLGYQYNRIINAPTVDAVPVRHGKWTVEWETEDTRMLRCSECRMVFNVGKGRDGNYCPNCGARMDAERKEE